MKKSFVLILLILLAAKCTDWYKDPPNIKVEVHGMKVGCDSALLGGKIFYIDTVKRFCLVALVTEETQFVIDCQYPTWSPYYKLGTVEKFRYIEGLSDTIGAGKRNTEILVYQYGCSVNSDCNYNNGFYGAACAFYFQSSLNEDGVVYDDYWEANLHEAWQYANAYNMCDPNWYSTSSQKDINNCYVVNCKDKRVMIEPKSQKRLPLLIRRHSF